jgi:WS/DGAT/MGAT family acyltransferase
MEPLDDSENLLDDVTHITKSLLNSSSLAGDMYLSVLRSGVGALLPTGSKRKPSLPFTAPVTRLDRTPAAGRSLAFCSQPFARINSLAKATGASLNDVLLTLLDMAVRQYLADSDAEPKKRLVALMPMTLREDIDPSVANCIAVLPVKLGRAKATPLERLRAIGEETAALKDNRDLSPDTAMATTLVLSGLAQVGEILNLVGSMPPLGNFIFSNVPGPRAARYRFDALVEEIYPISCLAPGSYLNITAFSYGGQIQLQFLALEKAAPDLGDLVEHLSHALQVMERELSDELTAVSVSEVSQPAAVKKPARAAAKPAAKTAKPARSRKRSSPPAKSVATKRPVKATAKAAAEKAVKPAATTKSVATATRPAARKKREMLVDTGVVMPVAAKTKVLTGTKASRS